MSETRTRIPLVLRRIAIQSVHEFSRDDLPPKRNFHYLIDLFATGHKVVKQYQEHILFGRFFMNIKENVKFDNK